MVFLFIGQPPREQARDSTTGRLQSAKQSKARGQGGPGAPPSNRETARIALCLLVCSALRRCSYGILARRTIGRTDAAAVCHSGVRSCLAALTLTTHTLHPITGALTQLHSLRAAQRSCVCKPARHVIPPTRTIALTFALKVA